MFERYTERARRVLFFARYEATQLGSTSIETEHLLLGLIREGNVEARPPSGEGSYYSFPTKEAAKQFRKNGRRFI